MMRKPATLSTTLLGALFAAGVLAFTPAPSSGAIGGRNRTRPGPYGAAGTASPTAAAQQQVKDAQLNVRDAQTAMNKIRARVQKSLESKGEWKNVAANAKKAKDDLEAAKKKVTQTLEKKAAYVKLKKEREAAQAKIDTLQGDKKADEKEITAAVNTAGDLGQQLRDMEQDAFAQDAAYQAAKTADVEAKAALAEIKAEVDGALADDPEYAQAEQALEQAELQLDQARESLIMIKKQDAESRRAQRESEAQQRRSSSGSRGSSRRSGRGGY